ncbi:MAG: metallophosphoesterase [candidate division Zixibacteria bacterium]|nr:metallophosphoesterase [candidate division Zixibacteria bacterium]
MNVANTCRFLILTTLLLLAVIYAVETHILQVAYREVVSSKLSSFFKDDVIVHITDLHITGLGWRETLLLESIEDINPALIVMTGDYVEDTVNTDILLPFFQKLSGISTVIAIWGNNDYCGQEDIETIFNTCGIMILDNETVELYNGLDTCYIVGVGDNTNWHDNYYLAVKGLTASHRRIVLSHAPASIEMIDSTGVELILSGHLHGGQIVLPLFGPLYDNRTSYVSDVYLEGFFGREGKIIYSNRGIGTSQIPLRFMSRPEIAVFRFIN